MSDPNLLAEDMGDGSQEPGSGDPISASSTPAITVSGSDPTTISFSDSPGDSLFSTEQLSISPYSQYLIDVKYICTSGIIQTGVGSPGAECEFIGVTGGLARKVVHWTAERIGAKPVLPHWETDNPNEPWLTKEIQPASVVLTPDSRQVYRVSGTYTYGLKRNLGEQDKLYSGSVPVDKLAASTQYIDGSQFSKEVVPSVMRG